MKSLAQVITALKMEIARAAADQKNLPNGLRVAEDRIVATLHFNIAKVSDEGSVQLDFDCQASGCTNSIQIELRTPAEPISSARGTTQSHQTRHSKISAAETPAIEHKFSEVFGKPGFDSSARATVFREAVENLTFEQVSEVIEILKGGTPQDVTATAKHAASLIARICQSGPSGKAGCQIVATLLRGYDTSELIGLVNRIWKTQQEWIS